MKKMFLAVLTASILLSPWAAFAGSSPSSQQTHRKHGTHKEQGTHRHHGEHKGQGAPQSGQPQAKPEPQSATQNPQPAQ